MMGRDEAVLGRDATEMQPLMLSRGLSTDNAAVTADERLWTRTLNDQMRAENPQVLLFGREEKHGLARPSLHSLASPLLILKRQGLTTRRFFPLLD